MSYLFYNCSSLKYLPNISKWKINETINLNHIFDGCSSLLLFPDISTWNINYKKLESISNIFHSTLISDDLSSNINNINNNSSSNSQKANSFLSILSNESFNGGKYNYKDFNIFEKGEDISIRDYYENFYTST